MSGLEKKNASRFTETNLVRKKLLCEKIAKFVIVLMTMAMVLPLLLIVGYLIYKAAPALSLDFLFDLPRRGMREGGIWPALLGTVYLVVVSLVIAAPVGVLAAVYLNEYAKENWFTRIINLAVINLAGVPSIVHALFGLGAFVLFAGIGRSILAASLTLAVNLPTALGQTSRSSINRVVSGHRLSYFTTSLHPYFPTSLLPYFTTSLLPYFTVNLPLQPRHNHVPFEIVIHGIHIHARKPFLTT